MVAGEFWLETSSEHWLRLLKRETEYQLWTELMSKSKMVIFEGASYLVVERPSLVSEKAKVFGPILRKLVVEYGLLLNLGLHLRNQWYLLFERRSEAHEFLTDSRRGQLTEGVVELIKKRKFEDFQFYQPLTWEEICDLRTEERAQIPFVGESTQAQNLRVEMMEYADTSVALLFVGPSGSGKEVLARLCHSASKRKKNPFIAVNCGAIPEGLIESELFGHEKGAFTGAHQQKLGKFELANGGTIFLDEIAEISPHLQVKLLRVLQDKVINRVGGTIPAYVDVRVVAATNRIIEDEIKSGRFREDLYYRFVATIRVPPLRERPEDIPLIVDHLLPVCAQEMGISFTPSVSTEAMQRLSVYAWPGNVREMQNVLSRAVLRLKIHKERVIDLHYLPERISNSSNQSFEDRDDFPVTTLAQMERKLIKETLVITDGNKTEAAHRLGISRQTLRSKIAKYGS